MNKITKFMIWYFVVPFAILGALFVVFKIFGGKDEHQI
jgi:hypothetical protein